MYFLFIKNELKNSYFINTLFKETITICSLRYDIMYNYLLV